jgi:hypothetical protein
MKLIAILAVSVILMICIYAFFCVLAYLLPLIVVGGLCVLVIWALTRKEDDGK